MPSTKTYLLCPCCGKQTTPGWIKKSLPYRPWAWTNRFSQRKIENLRRYFPEEFQEEYPEYFDLLRDHIVLMVARLYEKGLVTKGDLYFVQAQDKLERQHAAIDAALDYRAAKTRVTVSKAGPGVVVQRDEVDMLSVIGLSSIAANTGTVVSREEVDA